MPILKGPAKFMADAEQWVEGEERLGERQQLVDKPVTSTAAPHHAGALPVEDRADQW